MEFGVHSYSLNCQTILSGDFTSLRIPRIRGAHHSNQVGVQDLLIIQAINNQNSVNQNSVIIRCSWQLPLCASHYCFLALLIVHAISTFEACYAGELASLLETAASSVIHLG
jgi:hypothetical protein